jgi:hypothetical protein
MSLPENEAGDPASSNVFHHPMNEETDNTLLVAGFVLLGVVIVLGIVIRTVVALIRRKGKRCVAPISRACPTTNDERRRRHANGWDLECGDDLCLRMPTPGISLGRTISAVTE